jgi:predicted ABC-type ATPase
LVVANLYVDALVELAPAIAKRVAAGGHLVTSGVLRKQQARVRAAYAPPEWRLRAAKRRGAWVTSVFQKRALAPDQKPALAPDEKRAASDQKRAATPAARRGRAAARG